MNYVICAEDNNNEKIFYNNAKTKMSLKEFKKYKEKLKMNSKKNKNSTDIIKYDSHNQLFSDSYDLASTVVIAPKYTSKYSSSKSLISQETIMKSTEKYDCAVVALTEVASQEQILKNSSIADTFNALWTTTFTTTTSTDNTFYGLTITLGSTYDSKLSSGMKSYANDRGKTNATTSTSSDPNFYLFVDIINGNYSGTLSYRIMEVSGETSGHTVNVIGYCTAQIRDVPSNYLIVANGWYDDAPQYMNYSTIDFVNTYGVKYVIE